MAEQLPPGDNPRPDALVHPIMQFVGGLIPPDAYDEITAHVNALNTNIEHFRLTKTNQNPRIFFAGSHLAGLSYWGASLQDMSIELFDNEGEEARRRTRSVLKSLANHIINTRPMAKLDQVIEGNPVTNAPETRYYLRYVKDPLINRSTFLSNMGLPAAETIEAAETWWTLQKKAQLETNVELAETSLDGLSNKEKVSSILANKTLIDVSQMGLTSLSAAWDNFKSEDRNRFSQHHTKIDNHIVAIGQAVASGFHDWTITKAETKPGGFFESNLRFYRVDGTPIYVDLEIISMEDTAYIQFSYFETGDNIVERRRKRSSDLSFYIGVSPDRAHVFSWDLIGKTYEDTLITVQPVQRSEVKTLLETLT